MSGKEFFRSVGKGILVSVIAALIGVSLFAAVVKIATLPVNAVKAVNQFIKVVAVFCGCFFSLKTDKGALKGATVGLFFTVIIYLVFLLIDGTPFMQKSFWLDLLFGTVVGAISGIMTVNVRGKV